MKTFANNDINLLRDFLSISHWQTIVTLILFFMTMIILSIVIKRTKMRFPIRVFLGMGLGLTFGLSLQAITGFNVNNITQPNLPGTNVPPTPNPNYVEWMGQTATWIALLKNIFIIGITMLTIPIVFLAITRITAKKTTGSQKLIQMSGFGIFILLLNVAIAFCIAFGLGFIFKIGQKFDLSASGTYDNTAAKNLPSIITGYIPNSFIGVFTQFLIIPVIILGALIGLAIKKLTKHNPEKMDSARNGLEILWKIINSILTMFIKIMPYAIMSMLASAIINNPIARLGDIGIIIGVAYLALLITFGWHLLSLFLFGVKPWAWLKKAQKPIITGFSSQSSNAALPIALDTLKSDLKINEAASDTIMPLSTTIGLSGCAGVQSGIILSFLWFSVINHGSFPQWTIALLFINGLIVTLVASLGIAGVPGTAAVVTAGVLGGLGFGSYYVAVYTIIGALDGLFDMGRTAVNISGGLQATAIVANSQPDMIEDPHLVYKSFPLKPVYRWVNKLILKHQVKKAQRLEKLKIKVLKKENIKKDKQSANE